MGYKENRAARKIERKDFSDAVKIYIKCNLMYQKDIAELMGLTRHEFTHFLSGSLSSSPSRGINNYDEFELKVTEILGDKFN